MARHGTMAAGTQGKKTAAPTLKKVCAVRRESEPAWCMGPMRGTESSSETFCRPPWRFGADVMRYCRGEGDGGERRRQGLSLRMGYGWLGGWMHRTAIHACLTVDC